MKKTYSIALVDNDIDAITSLSALLEGEGYSVNSYTDSRSALAAFKRKMPDLAIFEVRMKGMDGIDLLQKVRHRSMVPVIFLSSLHDEIDQVLGLRTGADDYVKKPYSEPVLLERIKGVLRRQYGRIEAEDRATDDGRAFEVGDLKVDPLSFEARWKGEELPLTTTQFLLLKEIARRPGFIRPREQLMKAAYGIRETVEVRTVDSHIKHLRKKIRQVDPEFEMIETMYGIGYRYKAA